MATKKTATKKSAAKKPAVKSSASTSSAAQKVSTSRKTAVKKTPAKKATTKKAATKKAPAKRVARKAVKKTLPTAPAPSAPLPVAASTPAPVTSTVIIKLDAGFGNTLFLRGSAPGLSWDEGVAMECVAPDEWVWSTESAKETFEVKPLLNDDVWSIGANVTVQPGEKAVIEPEF